MKIKRLRYILIAVFLFSIPVFAQQSKTAPLQAAQSLTQAIKSSPAFAEILLRQTELESILEDFSVSYTEDFPKVKEARYELNLIRRDFTKLLSTKDSGKLTLALGKLMVRRAQLETDLWALQAKFGEAHPDVQRAKRRVATFDKAIGEILQ